MVYMMMVLNLYSILKAENTQLEGRPARRQNAPMWRACDEMIPDRLVKINLGEQAHSEKNQASELCLKETKVPSKKRRCLRKNKGAFGKNAGPLESVFALHLYGF